MAEEASTDQGFKSKNLKAEKLRDCLFRTEWAETMNKPTIITGAITYIQKLRRHVRDLSDQFFEMEATIHHQQELKIETSENDAEQEMKKWGIQGMDGVKLAAEQSTELLLEIIRSM